MRTIMVTRRTRVCTACRPKRPRRQGQHSCQPVPTLTRFRPSMCCGITLRLVNLSSQKRHTREGFGLLTSEAQIPSCISCFHAISYQSVLQCHIEAMYSMSQSVLYFSVLRHSFPVAIQISLLGLTYQPHTDPVASKRYIVVGDRISRSDLGDPSPRIGIMSTGSMRPEGCAGQYQCCLFFSRLLSFLLRHFFSGPFPCFR